MVLAVCSESAKPGAVEQPASRIFQPRHLCARVSTAYTLVGRDVRSWPPTQKLASSAVIAPTSRCPDLEQAGNDAVCARPPLSPTGLLRLIITSAVYRRGWLLGRGRLGM